MPWGVSFQGLPEKQQGGHRNSRRKLGPLSRSASRTPDSYCDHSFYSSLPGSFIADTLAELRPPLAPMIRRWIGVLGKPPTPGSPPPCGSVGSPLRAAVAGVVKGCGVSPDCAPSCHALGAV